MWFVYALGSAVFAALTSILAKIGIEGVNSTLATAIRTAVVLLMSWGMVFLTGTQTGIADISRRSWLFLVLWWDLRERSPRSRGRRFCFWCCPALPPAQAGCATTTPCRSVQRPR